MIKNVHEDNAPKTGQMNKLQILLKRFFDLITKFSQDKD